MSLDSLWVLWLPSSVQRHADSGVKLDRDSKLAVGVNSCLSLCKLCDRLVNCPERWMLEFALAKFRKKKKTKQVEDYEESYYWCFLTAKSFSMYKLQTVS